jgi:hypothetical protein
MEELTHRVFPFIFGVRIEEKKSSLVMEFRGSEFSITGNDSVTLADVLRGDSDLAQWVGEDMSQSNWLSFALDIAEGINHLHHSPSHRGDSKQYLVVISSPSFGTGGSWKK